MTAMEGGSLNEAVWWLQNVELPNVTIDVSELPPLASLLT